RCEVGRETRVSGALGRRDGAGCMKGSIAACSLSTGMITEIRNGSPTAEVAGIVDLLLKERHRLLLRPVFGPEQAAADEADVSTFFGEQNRKARIGESVGRNRRGRERVVVGVDQKRRAFDAIQNPPRR